MILYKLQKRNFIKLISQTSPFGLLGKQLSQVLLVSESSLLKFFQRSVSKVVFEISNKRVVVSVFDDNQLENYYRWRFRRMFRK